VGGRENDSRYRSPVVEMRLHVEGEVLKSAFLRQSGNEAMNGVRRMMRGDCFGRIVLCFSLGLSLLAAGCGSSPLPPVVVNVTPTTAYVPIGASYQFAATVTGTSNGDVAVTWDVNGIVGGNSTFGFVSSKGFYKAPVTIPSPSTVTVTATSQDLDTKSSTATVHIVSQTAGANIVPVTSGQTASNVDVVLQPIAPTLVIYGAGGCEGSTCSTAATGVEVAQGGSAAVYLVGEGLVSGTVYSISGNAADVDVVQPSDTQFGSTNDGTPSVSFQITVSATATPGPRNIVVKNPTTGELSAFVGGLLITSSGS